MVAIRPGRRGSPARAVRSKEIVGGAEVSDANGVPPAVGCLAARSLGHRTKREAGYQSLDFLVSLVLVSYAKLRNSAREALSGGSF